MRVSVQSLPCANCGAPLTAGSMTRAQGGLWPCLHCGAVVRVAEGAAPVVAQAMPPELAARVRQLVVEGRTDEAKRLAAGIGVDAAVVDQLANEVMVGVLFAQKLNPVGGLMLLVWLSVAAVGAWLVSTGYVAGWALVVVGLVLPIPLLRAAVTTLKMAGAPQGLATVRRATLLGMRQLRRPVAIYAFDVAVAPVDRSPGFVGTLLVPVRQESMHKAVPGAALYVRFDRADRRWIRFEKLA